MPHHDSRGRSRPAVPAPIVQRKAGPPRVPAVPAPIVQPKAVSAPRMPAVPAPCGGNVRPAPIVQPKAIGPARGAVIATPPRGRAAIIQRMNEPKPGTQEWLEKNFKKPARDLASKVSEAVYSKVSRKFETIYGPLRLPTIAGELRFQLKQHGFKYDSDIQNCVYLTNLIIDVASRFGIKNGKPSSHNGRFLYECDDFIDGSFTSNVRCGQEKAASLPRFYGFSSHTYAEFDGYIYDIMAGNSGVIVNDFIDSTPCGDDDVFGTWSFKGEDADEVTKLKAPFRGYTFMVVMKVGKTVEHILLTDDEFGKAVKFEKEDDSSDD